MQASAASLASPLSRVMLESSSLSFAIYQNFQNLGFPSSILYLTLTLQGSEHISFQTYVLSPPFTSVEQGARLLKCLAAASSMFARQNTLSVKNATTIAASNSPFSRRRLVELSFKSSTSMSLQHVWANERSFISIAIFLPFIMQDKSMQHLPWVQPTLRAGVEVTSQQLSISLLGLSTMSQSSLVIEFVSSSPVQQLVIFFVVLSVVQMLYCSLHNLITLVACEREQLFSFCVKKVFKLCHQIRIVKGRKLGPRSLELRIVVRHQCVKMSPLFQLLQLEQGELLCHHLDFQTLCRDAQKSILELSSIVAFADFRADQTQHQLNQPFDYLLYNVFHISLPFLSSC